MSIQQQVVSIFLLSVFSIPQLFAANRADVREKWHTPYELYLSPDEAYALKSATPDKIMFIDVRTRAEVKYIGLATTVDAHIPIRFLNTNHTWSKKKNTYRTNANKNFAAEVEILMNKMNLDKSSPIILICQSGSRVPIAAKALYKAGFEEVYTQHEGFEGLKSSNKADMGARNVNGWKKAGLPWSYDLEPAKMYFNFESEISHPAQTKTP